MMGGLAKEEGLCLRWTENERFCMDDSDMIVLNRT
jgi:hypothetical protein